MADAFTKAKRSEVMTRIRSRGNRDMELALAKLERANGIPGWRRHFAIRKTESGKRKFKARPISL
jgi:DNA mismatch endonuclease (patch repair protein)